MLATLSFSICWQIMGGRVTDGCYDWNTMWRPSHRSVIVFNAFPAMWTPIHFCADKMWGNLVMSRNCFFTSNPAFSARSYCFLEPCSLGAWVFMFWKRPWSLKFSTLLFFGTLGRWFSVQLRGYLGTVVCGAVLYNCIVKFVHQTWTK